MEFRPIERRSIVQRVAEQLRDAVVASVVRSSHLPSEAALSSALMVSRPTLREAIRILEAEGLVQRDHRTASLRPDAGTTSMSRPLRSALDILTRTERITMAEIVDLRVTVEARAAERAAEVATEEDAAELAEALGRLRDPGLTEQQWDERALAFHVAMVKASHNEAFLLIVIAAREAAADILERAILSATRPETRAAAPGPRSADEEWFEQQYDIYCELYDAITAGRADDARECVWSWAKACGGFFEPPTTGAGDTGSAPGAEASPALRTGGRSRAAERA